MPEQRVRVLASHLGEPHDHDEGGWPEFEITLTYYVEGTENLERVRELAIIEAETTTRKGSAFVNPDVDSYCWHPDGWEMAGEGTVHDAETTTRGEAASWFNKYGPMDFPSVRVWKRHVLPSTYQELWDDLGRERVAWRLEHGDPPMSEEEAWEVTGAVVPDDWEPHETDPVWSFVARGTPGSMPVWVCGCAGDTPPPAPTSQRTKERTETTR